MRLGLECPPVNVGGEELSVDGEVGRLNVRTFLLPRVRLESRDDAIQRRL